MQCSDIQYWLETREPAEKHTDPLILRHLEACGKCRRLHGLDLKIEHLIRQELVREEAPQRLKDALDGRFRDIGAGFSDRVRYAGLAVAAVLVLAIGFLVVSSPFSLSGFDSLQALGKQAIQDHLKGNMTITFEAGEGSEAAERLGRELGFKVAIPDLSDRGYRLIGGRKCLLGHCDVVYLVYDKNGSRSSLFILDPDHLRFQMGEGSSFSDTIRGCWVKIWKDQGQIYALVG